LAIPKEVDTHTYIHTYIHIHTQERRIHELGCVIIDEAHMIGDSQRGVLLEITLSKLLYVGTGIRKYTYIYIYIYIYIFVYVCM
jgi:superfamily II helicase